MTRLIAALAVLLSVAPLQANRIKWFSTIGAVNLTSTGSVMDGGFRFELGVFEGTFVPDPTNKHQWAQNWKCAMRKVYNPVDKRFDSVEHVFYDNDSPFTVNKPTYIWGFRGNAQSGEWILFRATAWNWPLAGPLNPEPLSWNVANANEVVIGRLNENGVLMESAAVTNAAPPSTTWELWQAEYLTDEPLDGPDDDPDKDGVSNLLEFVFDTPPKTAGPPPQTPVTLVEIEGSKYLQITIPRRIDHKATLVVEVSSDLTNWNSNTSLVPNGLTSLVVRDNTAFAPPLNKRFMRLRASVP